MTNGICFFSSTLHMDKITISFRYIDYSFRQFKFKACTFIQVYINNLFRIKSVKKIMIRTHILKIITSFLTHFHSFLIFITPCFLTPYGL